MLSTISLPARFMAANFTHTQPRLAQRSPGHNGIHSFNAPWLKHDAVFAVQINKVQSKHLGDPRGKVRRCFEWSLSDVFLSDPVHASHRIVNTYSSSSSTPTTE